MAKAGFIAIVGRPNSGKSTLLNSVLGAKVSIVSPKAQTTRDQVLGILTEEQRGQIVFVDTPGIHRAREGGLNEYMVHQAAEALDSPDLIWYLVDPFSALEHEQAVLDLLLKSKRPVVLLMNKVDILSGKSSQAKLEALEKTLEEFLTHHQILKGKQRISALNQEGVKNLLAESWESLPEGPYFYPDPEAISDRPTRYFVSEKIRESLFYHLGQEIPYSCAVEIETFNEKVKPPRVEAMIYVERESQKGIVIGQGGKKIKEIGQAARKQIEEFLGNQIFLGLRVKVLKDWSENPESLKRMGYTVSARRQG